MMWHPRRREQAAAEVAAADPAVEAAAAEAE